MSMWNLVIGEMSRVDRDGLCGGLRQCGKRAAVRIWEGYRREGGDAEEEGCCGTRGRGQMNVTIATFGTGMPRGGRGCRRRRLAGASGQELPGDNVAIPTLNVDHPVVQWLMMANFVRTCL